LLPAASCRLRERGTGKERKGKKGQRKKMRKKMRKKKEEEEKGAKGFRGLGWVRGGGLGSVNSPPPSLLLLSSFSSPFEVLERLRKEAEEEPYLGVLHSLTTATFVLNRDDLPSHIVDTRTV
jgi:hypothetical protein